MDSRLTLHEELCKILGSRNVYFNTPESVKMKYPAIRYSLSDLDNRSASNEVYIQHPTYSLILIDKDPDSPVAKKLSVLSRCRLSRPPYPANGLYHFPFTLKTTNGNISGVLTEQYNQGYADCEQNYSDVAARVEQAYEAGQKAEYDCFWDNFQQNGNRKNYQQAFRQTWNDTIFKPKYDIKPVNCGQMFQTTGILDLKGLLEKAGVILDTSNSTTCLQMFQESSVNNIPTIDLTKATNTGYAFASSAIKHIERLVVTETTPFLTNTFGEARNLVYLQIEGVIGVSINLSYSPLTVDSMKSVISCLKNYAGTENELTHKVSFTGECWEALEASGAAPNGGTWADYVFSLGWNT